ncbi:MAG: FHA domain-containing protein [Sedimentisphaerales bacterium]|nr:FHA domain-containing protein [Sedimentisphaerales bacterium]
MRLNVKKDGQTVNELRFTKGPLTIGRHAHSQIYLPDRAVSWQHAVIYTTQDSKWVIEDLKSANKTYLNDKAIQKAEIKTGDRIRVGDFEIDVELEAGTESKGDIHLEDTLISETRRSVQAAPAATPKIIVRKADDGLGPDIKLPAIRIVDFLSATEAICKANGPDDVLKTLLKISLKQFNAYHSWCALRNVPDGPMTSHAGKSRNGDVLELSHIKVHKIITQAIDKKEFVLIPHVSSITKEKDVCSAIIAPILDPDGCFGVFYVDNAIDQAPYRLSDLDYLMLLTIHIAAVIENF